MAAVADESVTIPTGSGLMPAHLWIPESGRGPGLLLLQEIFGVTDYIKQRAADLCALGYVVLAPETYWRLEGVSIDESRADFLEQALAAVSRLDWSLAVSDSRDALDHLRQRPEVGDKAGVIGFCFGGGLGFNLAAIAKPDVLVSYYGSALPNLLGLAPQVEAPSLHHFGLDDAYLDQEAVARIKAAVTGPDAVVITYAGAGHAFDNPHPAFHHRQASEQAWQATRDFLAQRFPTA